MTNTLWIIGHLLIALLCVPLAVIDWREHRLPNPLTLAVAIVALATVLVGSSGSGNSDWAVDSLLGAAIFAGPLLAIHLVQPAWMGFGDIKLTAGLGLLLGWYEPAASFQALFVGLLLAFPHAVWSLVAERRAKKAVRESDSEEPVAVGRIPFGPYLIGGAAVVLALLFRLPG